MTRDAVVPPSSAPPSVEDVLSLQRDVIAQLIRSPALAQGDLSEAIRLVTESAARLLDVRRASVWRFDETRTRIECLDLYDREAGTHRQGLALDQADAPTYFAAVREERCIVANDARTDPRTREFAQGYLEPNEIASMLDAPVLVRGTIVGMVCHEHVGSPREWLTREELLAGTLADFVGMALSAAEHAAQARELGQLRDGLEVLVEERTRELSESRENVRALFEASPVAMVLTRLSDQTIQLANRRATDLFEVPAETARGRRVPDFWVDLSARDHLLELVRQRGRVEGYDTELRSLPGRTFWGSVSVQGVVFDGEASLLVSVEDITEKKLAEQELRRSREFLWTLLDAAPIPLVVTDVSDGVVRFSNERAADMFETDLQSFIGLKAPDLFLDPSERDVFIEQLRRQGRVDGFAARLKSVPNRPFWAQLSARALHLGNDDSVFMLGFLDVTEQKQLEARLRELATIDGLTGVYNRRQFFELADPLLELAERHERPLSVAMIDADHFKAINDEHGHAVGDEALRVISQVCRAELRATDLLARYGGEEFVALFPETASDAAYGAVERIRAMLATSPVTGGATPVYVTVSAGIAARRAGETLDDVLRRADEALYRGKQAGRNRVVVSE